MEYYSAVKRNKLLIHPETRVNHKYSMLMKDSKGYIWSNFTYMTFWKRLNYRDRKTDQWLSEIKFSCGYGEGLTERFLECATVL